MRMRTRVAAIGAMATVALAGAAAPAMAAKTIKVSTKSGLSFTGMPSTLKPGTYTFRYTNSSGIDHNLKVGTKVTPTFDEGTRSITVTLKKGKVSYLCTLRGHAAAGMKGTIIVK